ncbi:hypothetical protein AB0425_17705 [Actinosynnema sp. NPDC051121]
MTTPEPVSPEVRRSPDGRLIAYCRSARHGLWRKSDGYDCEPEDVADWTPLMPAVSPAPDTEALRADTIDDLRDLIADALDMGGFDDPHARSYANAVMKVVGPVVEGLRADLDQARAERNTLMLALVTLLESLGIEGRAVESSPLGEAMRGRDEVERLRADLFRSGARTIPDDAAERVADALRDVRLNLGPNALEAIYGGANHLILSGGERQAIALTAIKALGLSTPTTDPAPEPAPEQTNPAQAASSGTVPQRFPVTDVQTNADPAPAAADVRWGVRIDGTSVQMFDSEHEAREWMAWTAPRADQSTFEVVTRMATEWTPATPQAQAEPTEYRFHVLSDCADQSTCPVHDGAARATPRTYDVLDEDANEPMVEDHDAAREVPDDYNDDLIPGRHVPSSPSRAHAHGEVPRG